MTVSFKVLLDSTDITSYARSYSFSRGQQDEMSGSEPGQATITFDNSDGTLTPGLGNTNGLELSRQIQLVIHATSDNTVFTGYIDAAPATWNDTAGNSSFVSVTATDIFGRLQRWALRSMLEEDILLDDPVAYYTMGDPSEAVGASESAGNGLAPLMPKTQFGGSNTAPVFGNGTGPADGLTAVQLTSGGQFLAATYSAPLVPAGTSGATLELCWAGTDANGTLIALSDGKYATTQHYPLALTLVAGKAVLTTNNGSGVTVLSTSSAAINDGNTHQIAVGASFSGSNAGFQFVVDGVSQPSYFYSGWGSWPSDINTIEVGNSYTNSSPGSTVGGTYSHATVYGTLLTTTRIQAHGNLVVGTPMDSLTLITRLCSYAGQSVTGFFPSLLDCPVPATSGSNVLDAIQSVSDAEGGLLFVDGSGGIQFKGRNWATVPRNSGSTIPSTAEVEADLTFPVDKQYLQNQITASRYTSDNSAPSITVADATSVTQHGAYPASMDSLLVSTDTEVTDAANWRLGTHKQPSASRISQATWDVLTLSTADANTILGFTQSEGAVLTINNLPSQAPVIGGSATIATVGVSGEGAIDECTITFNTVDPALYGRNCWQLNASSLGTNTALYY